MKKIISIILALFLTTSYASALEWGTLTIGASGNYSGFYGTGKEEEYDETGATLELTTEETGAFDATYPSVFVEFGNDLASIGVDYVPVDIDSPKNTNDSDGANLTNPTTEVSVSFEHFTTVYGLVRIPFAGLYAKAGYSMVDIQVNETTRSGNEYPDTDTNGYTIAFGTQIDTDAGISIRAEIAAHEFDDVSVDNNSTNKNVVSVGDMIGATGRISIANYL